MKTARYWHKNRHEFQWNIIEDPDMNSSSNACKNTVQGK
jgi:hypothetical protein